jgi:NodT family efflux transporter outer membrane factor (OMF) lipoprotein
MRADVVVILTGEAAASEDRTPHHLIDAFTCLSKGWKFRARLVMFVAIMCLCKLLAGCKVGPTYHSLPAPLAANYKEPPPANWKEAQPQDTALRGIWWEMFGDARLNAIMEQVNVSNQNIAAAEAQFRAARAAIRVAGAGLFPVVTFGANAATARISSARSVTQSGFSIGTGTFYQLPLDVSYEADVWGRVRRNIEANVATAQAAAADVESVRLSMQAELALDYFQLRGLDEERRLYEATIDAYQRALQLTMNRHHGGVASQLDVSQAQTQLETARAQAIDIGVMRAQFEHAIAVLMGRPPAEFAIAPEPYPFQVPVIPVGFPSELLERRPDVAGAERRIAAANAQIGVAKAALFPQLTFSLTAGLASSSLGTLLSWPSRFWSLGPALSQIVFDGGQRRATVQQIEAQYDVAAAQYRQDVLNAFQEVEDNLAALRILAEEAKQQDIAIQSAQRSLDLSLNRYRGGVASYLDVIAAQNALLDNQRAAVGVRTRQMQAAVLLIEALGGGWSTAQLPSSKDLR